MSDRTELRCENPAYDTARTPQCNLQFVVCWCLFFKVNSLQVLTNVIVFLSICTDLDTEHEFILFLWVGKSPNRPQRRYLGLALLALWQALVRAWLVRLADVLTNRGVFILITHISMPQLDSSLQLANFAN